MAGHHPWRALREHGDARLTPEQCAEVAARVAVRRDPAFLARESEAATRLDSARDRAAYVAARRAVRAELGLDPDAVPHDPPPGVAERLAAVRGAVGSVELEGLAVDPDIVAVLERVACGELTFAAARAALLARLVAERRHER